MHSTIAWEKERTLFPCTPLEHSCCTTRDRVQGRAQVGRAHDRARDRALGKALAHSRISLAAREDSTLDVDFDSCRYTPDTVRSCSRNDHSHYSDLASRSRIDRSVRMEAGALGRVVGDYKALHNDIWGPCNLLAGLV